MPSLTVWALHPSTHVLTPPALAALESQSIHDPVETGKEQIMADDMNTTRRNDNVTSNTGRTDASRASETDWDKDNRTVNRDVDRDLSDRETKDTNPDAITGAPGSHPVGTGLGAAAAGAAGAAIGSVIPGAGTVVGGVVGAVIGAVAGGLAGKGVAEAVNPTAEDAYWRSEHRNRPYYTPGADYDRDYAPAYRYGYTSASQHTGKAWDEVENDMERGWDKTRDKSSLSWGQAKSAARDAWDRVTTTSTGAARSDTMYGSDYDDNYFRNQYNGSSYFSSDYDYDNDYAPAYRYGFSSARQHAGRSWNDTERDMESGWNSFKGKSRLSWDRAKNAVKDAWEHATGGGFDRRYDADTVARDQAKGTSDYAMGSSVTGNTATTNSAGTERRDLEDNTGKRSF
jgi:hypothetical protein